MANKLYSVKEITEILDIEAHVLRFYEKELNLQIQRNAQGHRTYTDENIERFRQIKDLRVQGLQLKAIENVIHNEEETGDIINQIAANTKGVIDITDRGNVKVKQFSEMMKETFKQALVENSEYTKQEIKKEIALDMQEMVHQKFNEFEVLQEQKNEEYYKKMDEAMREMQRMRKELAEKQVIEQRPKDSLWRRIFGSKDKSISIE